MADEGSGTRQYREGFDFTDGREISRIDKLGELFVMKSKRKQEEVKLNQELLKVQQDVDRLRDDLQGTNEKITELRRQLKATETNKAVELTQDEMSKISGVTQNTIQDFLAPRPQLHGTQEEPLTCVDVVFLAGEELTGISLRIGGEGAGSRHAKFQVRYSDTVESLAEQAARYWGLEVKHVFFLDNQSRIVPSNMVLKDIILPPEPKAPAPPGGAGGHTPANGAIGTFDKGTLAKPEGMPESYVLKGRNYTLTLVRATTVLDAEDLTRPKGEKLEDFTFNENALNQELENTRKKREQADGINSDRHDPQIPSLRALIDQGELKKQKRLLDTYSRTFEAGVFGLSYFLFLVLALYPNSAWTSRMNKLMMSVEYRFTTFTNSERSVLGAANLQEITSDMQVYGWIEGPLQRGLVHPAMENTNLFSLGAIAFYYESNNPELTDNDIDGVFCGPESSSGNATANSTSGNATNSTESTSSDASCVPARFKQCYNSRVVNIFNWASEAGDHVPDCKRGYEYWDAQAILEQYDEPFDYIRGNMKSYVNGVRVRLNTASVESFQTDVQKLKAPANGVEHAATSITTFVYSPTMNGLMIVQFLFERNQAGSVVAKTVKTVVELNDLDIAKVFYHAISALLCFGCFLMEVRRIMGWPEKFEDSTDSFSVVTLLFLALPAAILVTLVVLILRHAPKAEDVLSLNADDQLTDDGISQLSNLLHLAVIFRNVNMICLFMYQLLLFQYLLMHFQQLVYLGKMVRKILHPLFAALVLLILPFAGLAMVFYCLYCAQAYEFRNMQGAVTKVVMFSQGTFTNWFDYYQQDKNFFLITMLVVFIGVTLMIAHLPLAIMLSHEKERMLRKNYSNHPFWAEAQSRYEDKNDFDPACQGWNFAVKPPAPVEKWPGSNELPRKIDRLGNPIKTD